MRRLRASASLRGLVRETQLSPARLVLPLFIAESGPAREPIESLPGVARHSLGAAAEEAAAAQSLGIAAVMLFGLPAEKDEQGSAAWDPEGVVRLVDRTVRFDGLVRKASDKIRQSARGMPAVLIRQLENLAKVALALGDGRERGILGVEAEMILRASEESVPEPSDRRDVLAAYQALEIVLGGIQDSPSA